MSGSTPPIEIQRFGRSQTPESPRPLHAPQPSNIPVLNNQMDPVFNDTTTYNIPSNHPFPPYSENPHNFPDSSAEDHDPVQSFFRGAEAESSLSQDMSGPEQSKPAETTIAPLNEPPSIPATAEPTENVSSNAVSAHFGSMPAQSSQPDASLRSTAHEEEANQKGDTQVFPSSSTEQHLPVEPSEPAEAKQDERGVDYLSLLDTISQSASTAPTADALTAPTTAAALDQPSNSLPSIPGLPPKPPAQDYGPEIASDKLYQANESAPMTHLVSFSQAPQDRQAIRDSMMAQAGEAGFQTNGIATVPAVYQTPTEISYPHPIDTSIGNAQELNPLASAPGDRPWSPNTQSIYDRFLEAERGYVTEGIWDKFPNGSRLFVGNLASEKVTKRDLFHIFHKHGRLAQISIKQAYGFVQFLEASSCHAALQAEQGAEIRGRKIHLEVSKPQKNTRGSGAGGGVTANKANARRRSRSPEKSRSTGERYGPRPTFSDYRDESARRREDFQTGRSASPRSYRSRDDYRSAQSPRGYQFQDPRPRSPPFPTFPPPFPAQGFDEDAALPIPRREPRDVPDVQLLILDPSVAPSFINWVEQTFRAKGLRASTIWLNPRLPLQAVIKRQIIEGVQAIVKLIQNNQFNSKVPLQVFDRTAGASNVNFNEYVDLDVSVAADIVLHARNKERSMPQQSPQTQYPPRPTFQPPTPYGHHMSQQSPQQYSPTGPPQFHQQRPPIPPPANHFPYPQPQQMHHHQAPATPTANTPNLQQLLANLGQPQNPSVLSPHPSSAQGPRQPDLGGLLSNIAAHQQNQNQIFNQLPRQPPQQTYGAPAAQHGYGGGQQSNVQNIMDQLARYQR